MTKIGAVLGKDYTLKEHEKDEDKKYFDKRGASVILKGNYFEIQIIIFYIDKKIGTIGVLHPDVLENF